MVLSVAKTDSAKTQNNGSEENGHGQGYDGHLLC